jgi:hypothetical protein
MGCKMQNLLAFDLEQHQQHAAKLAHQFAQEQNISNPLQGSDDIEETTKESHHPTNIHNRGIIPAPYSKLNNYLAGYVPPGLLINRSAFGNTGIERLAMKKIPEHLFIARNHNLDIRR